MYIHNLTLEDSGEYKCLVRSIVGDLSSVTNLLVDGPPGIIGNIIYQHKNKNKNIKLLFLCIVLYIYVYIGGVQAEVFKTSSVKLRWTDGSSNGRQITRYIVLARSNWNTTWFTLAKGFFL